MTTNADLIVEMRRLQATAYEPDALAIKLADALEASEAQVARLRAEIRECGLYASHGNWPADLLEAVQHFAVIHRQGTGHPRSECEQARATLVRYGWLALNIRGPETAATSPNRLTDKRLHERSP